jgi:hypothetical protein
LSRRLSRFSEKTVIQTAQTRRNASNWVADVGAPELSTERVELAEAVPVTGLSPDIATAMANLVGLEQGLYALGIGEAAGQSGQISGLSVPAVQVSVPPSDRDRCVEIIGTSSGGEAWFGHDGGTVIVKSPPGGGHVLVTAYGLPGQIVPLPRVEVQRLDRPRSNSGGPGLVAEADEREEIRTEVVLHMERLGDRRFPGQGWIGNRGQKLRIEAFSIRPIETLAARDVEFKALGPNRRQTPWVTDAKLCGTRGQGLPLTGFAVRVASHISDRFDVVYEGSFFESGVVGPNRNGELCTPPIADDPLEAINVRLIRRAAQ